MSTKVYSAYRVEKGDVVAVYDMLNKLSNQYNESVISFMGGIYENAKVASFSEFSDIFDEMDFESSVVLYLHKGKIYIQFFGCRYTNPEKLPMLQEMIDNGTLIDYHYQNQSDPWFYYDESIHESQYERLEEEHSERGEVWDEIFDECSSPSKVGLVKEFKPSMIDINLYHIYATKKQESESAQEV